MESHYHHQMLQHKEQVMFQNLKTRNFQLSHDLHNVYYHAQFECVRRKYSKFNEYQHLHVNSDVQHRLKSQHKAYLARNSALCCHGDVVFCTCACILICTVHVIIIMTNQT